MSRSWPAPLDKTVAVQARDISLRDGLDRVAAAGKFRISYSAELLPLDKHVCVSAESVIAGEALLQLLAGSGIEAVATSPDQVVLTPKKNESREEPVTATVQTLDRVVVTGSATGNAQRPLSVALDVIDGVHLSERGSSTMSQTLNGGVPGLWVWEQSPASLLVRYGSIRGASSFGLSYPKVYIDGIEVANPALMVDVNPGSLDHIEVIRGPQGAALYGADAISGVVNIVTRHDGTQAGAERAQVTTGAGLSQTSYTPKSVFAQNHALTLRGGSSMRSGTLTINATTLGDYVPGAYSRDVKINGSARAVTSLASLTGTARFYGKQAAIGENPLVSGFSSVNITRRSSRTLFSTVSDPLTVFDDSLPESIKEYTAGGNATFFTSGRWTPSMVAGIDGYTIQNVPNDFEALPPAMDTTLRSTRAAADRGTARASVVGQFGDPARRGVGLTFAAEQSALREVLLSGAGGDSIVWRTNTAGVAQTNLALDSVVYITGGLRLERNDGFTSSSQLELLPMVGFSVVRDYGDNVLKMRMAYGKGIRPSQMMLHQMQANDDRYRIRSAAPQLEPEEQSGTEIGVDLLVQHHLGIHLTRFDQTAFNLVQPVIIPVPRQGGGGGSGGGGGGGQRELQYTFQNVGQIVNGGWELESSLDIGALSVTGSLATVDSRVLQVAPAYAGDLRVGDRVLGVPSTTTGLTATWRRSHWYASAGVSRAADWINYDRLALTNDMISKAFVPDSMNAQQLGRALRSYWMHYDGVNRLRASFSRDLTSSFSFTLSGDNLTNVQRGEPDNITVLPGRTFLLGLTAKIR